MSLHSPPLSLPSATRPAVSGAEFGEPRVALDGGRLILRVDLPRAGPLPSVELVDGQLEIRSRSRVPLRLRMPEGVTADDVEATLYRGALEVSLPISRSADPASARGSLAS